ncbi:MBL fold metallo-hydrolase [Flagellimonas meridianipacifica]|uniref:Pyrroloquinoline quinone biosynthesis protein B n=1 Tax=Flagellimonas meridianipacifica TaxID=1080225 RepID=A0A2T0M8W4_9FLAO|nr:MBL fold metallo-hydrolase [Allomuricauda pacifica]PRX53915.1 pyrroloquinoline quinone biosynthesis protein B [Allomuricauda pacifica]
MINRVTFLLMFLILTGCNHPEKTKEKESVDPVFLKKGITLHVLGTIQDGGSPHIGCERSCCQHLFKNPDKTRKVVSLGLVNHNTKKTYLFEATPDLPGQLSLLSEVAGKASDSPNGIFVTHAHMGHYTGLMYLGREAYGAMNIPVFTMPKMTSFLNTNGPWNQLIELNNIVLELLENQNAVKLSDELTVIPFLVPHRDEYSETVGFKIMGPNKTVLFIPDINKWSVWNKSIAEEIKKVDFAFLDGTFYSGEELNHRDISEIPHPFVIESMDLFKSLPEKEKKKIHFIHFNHTNPLLDKNSDAYQTLINNGFQIASFMDVFNL